MIILFDVDGVLLKSYAYRVSLQNAVRYFSQRLGLGDLTLTDEEMEVFESQSITVEWDSGAISMAALLVERLKGRSAKTAKKLPEDFWALVEALGARPTSVERPDFSALAQRIGTATPHGHLPSHTALKLFGEDLPVSAPWLSQLLSNCYSIEHAPAMQLFQNYALGHVQYEHYYGLPAHVQGQPLLEELDRVNLRPQLAERLLSERAAGNVFPALYTARPSLAPREVGDGMRGYTPEAETARRMAGLDPIPIIAFGKVEWLGRRVGLSGRDLVKPSPVHAIAAMGAARTGLEVESLKAALAVVRGDHLRYPLTECKGEAIHVFEDSASSLRAVTEAVELLNRQGLNLTLTRHGIAPEGSPKQATLGAIADVVHKSVNDGLERILS
jgi:hypothetical protein